MKKWVLFVILIVGNIAQAQVKVNLSLFKKGGEVKAVFKKQLLHINWPAGNNERGEIILDINNEKPLISSLLISRFGKMKEIGVNLDPVFLLTVGKRDLVSQNGWNIFFDKTNKLPHTTYKVQLNKRSVNVSSAGSRTIIQMGDVQAGTFRGVIEVTLYNGSPLFNIAAVMSTPIDSTAILYDAGLISKNSLWKNIAWTNTENQPQSTQVNATDTSKNLPVKYRTIIGESEEGSLAIFPAPHQYFYPLDEAFNLKFTWYGTDYRKMVPEFGMGIRQDLMGDQRWVPWFNAPPNTKQRLNFFCLLNAGSPVTTMELVKQFTHSDSYKPLPGYKTMSSHFHNEYVMQVVLAGKEKPGTPNFVNVFKNTGIDIVHLGEFHYTAHPKGPD